MFLKLRYVSLGIFCFAVIGLAIFKNQLDLAQNKREKNIKVGQLYGNSVDRNPFVQDTIKILDIKEGFVLYQNLTEKTAKESCTLTDFEESALYLIEGVK